MISTVGVSVDVLQEQFYIGTNNHLYRLYWPSSGGVFNQDMTALLNGPAVDPSRGLSSLINANNDEHIFFFDSNGHMWDTWLGGGATPPYTQASDWGIGDISAASGATTFAAPGSRISVTGATSESLQAKYYVGPEGHLYRLYIVSSGGFNQDMATTAISGDSADSGTISLTAGGFTATVCYGHSTNSACTGKPLNLTAMDVAAALTQAFNTSSSPASANVNGATINLVWKTAGAIDPSVAALTTVHDQPSVFPNVSFTSTATTFTGGEASPTIFSLTYDFHLGAGNNGNVWAITNNKDSSRSQTFSYDPLNRLTSAQNTGTNCSSTTVNGRTEYWGNNYGYDPWGNLISKSVTKCSAENLSITVNTNNQYQSSYTYDAAGNMMHDATANLNYTYDAENRISAAAGQTYLYDGNGNRLEKTTGGNSPTGTLYWYASVGVVAESDLTGALQHEYVFYAGRRIARKDMPANSVFYYFSDHLKKASVITDSAGNIKAESDYYPWGGELQILNNDSNDYKFAGKKRDIETGLDYFGARYYSNGMGRFVTADWSSGPATVPYAHLDNPQTLNLYSYVDNNPASGMDADGHTNTKEYMLAQVGSSGFGPYFTNGPIIETTTDYTITISIDSETNIATVISVQTNSVTSGLSETLNGATSQTSTPGTSATPNDYVQSGINNAKNALTAFSQQQLSSTCSAFLDELGASAPTPFTSKTLQAWAASAVPNVFDGPSSPATLQSAGYTDSGTVGNLFRSKLEVNGLSQLNGYAIYVRSTTFASAAYLGADGKPTGFAIAEMVHELTHKFGYLHPNLENHLGPAWSNAAHTFGSMAVSVAINANCQ